MADVMKFRLTVEVTVATHDSERAVRRRLKGLVREALPVRGSVLETDLWPIDGVLDLAVRIKNEDAFAHDHVESGCMNYGELGWSCGRAPELLPCTDSHACAARGCDDCQRSYGPRR